jgi:hypothetical protein
VERGVWVYEAYEVKKGGKIKLSLTCRKKIFYIYLLSLYFTGKQKRSTIHYSFCKNFLEEIAHIRNSGVQLRRPNSCCYSHSPRLPNWTDGTHDITYRAPLVLVMYPQWIQGPPPTKPSSSSDQSPTHQPSNWNTILNTQRPSNIARLESLIHTSRTNRDN